MPASICSACRCNGGSERRLGRAHDHRRLRIGYRSITGTARLHGNTALEAISKRLTAPDSFKRRLIEEAELTP